MDAVERLGARGGEIPSRGGQLSILSIIAAGEQHAPHAVDFLSVGQSLAIDPQQFAECRRVSAIGFLLGRLFRLDQDDIAAGGLLLQPQHDPLLEATDFEDRGIAVMSGEFVHLLEEGFDLLRSRTNLSSQQDFSVCVSHRDGDLLAMQIDSEVEHPCGSPV